MVITNIIILKLLQVNEFKAIFLCVSTEKNAKESVLFLFKATLAHSLCFLREHSGRASELPTLPIVMREANGSILSLYD